MIQTEQQRKTRQRKRDGEVYGNRKKAEELFIKHIINIPSFHERVGRARGQTVGPQVEQKFTPDPAATLREKE